MSRGNNNRLLKLKEILFNETDDAQSLDIDESMHKLISCSEDKYDERTIKRDMECLDEANSEIQTTTGRYGKILYSHQARLFETYQLRLIVDAILSAGFITAN